MGGMEAEACRPSAMTLPPLGGLAPMEVIPATQPAQMNTKGNVYKEILASIGLDSPTTSQETRNKFGDTVVSQDQDRQMVNTPICNSANSLIALDKQVLTPGQGKIWELRKMSPLGRQQEIGRGSQ